MSQCNLKKLNLSEVNDLETLKTLGSYFSLKNMIEESIGFKLGVKGWNSLLDKILTIKVELKNRDYFNELISKEKLSDSKERIKKKLGVEIKARTKKQLNERFGLLVSLFNVTVFNPFEKFEKNKRRNFINSSKLEGIQIESESENTSLDALINKYKVCS
tara:strand:- start:94 stop:573 length:480 start_codon:yes stop_codon:yes gene_type:complete